MLICVEHVHKSCIRLLMLNLIGHCSFIIIMKVNIYLLSWGRKINNLVPKIWCPHKEEEEKNEKVTRCWAFFYCPVTGTNTMDFSEDKKGKIIPQFCVQRDTKDDNLHSMRLKSYKTGTKFTSIAPLPCQKEGWLFRVVWHSGEMIVPTLKSGGIVAIVLRSSFVQ